MKTPSHKEQVEELCAEIIAHFICLAENTYTTEEHLRKLPIILSKALLTAEKRERERIENIMGRVSSRHWAGIKRCPLDPLGQCDECQIRATLHSQIKKAITNHKQTP